jgi:molybdenum cofactor cytidylyltransferase
MSLSMSDHPISIILLAAGLSRRMGSANKLLLPFRETTLVEYCADKLLSPGAKEIIVVTGHEAPRVHFRLHDRPFRFAYNPNYASGMTSSIQQGVHLCHPESKGVLICQADMPNLEVADLEKIVATIQRDLHREQLIVVPCIGEQMGNPVFFSRSFFESILAHKEAEGCRGIIKANEQYVVKVLLENERAFDDVDTAEDYQRY